MYKISYKILLILFFNTQLAFSQTPECKVLIEALNISYVGDCKKGMANGYGEAKGLVHQYKGFFKKGMPNGEGEYIYNPTTSYNGQIQDGLKEGKGVLTIREEGKKDSVLTGYWSGDVFRGDKYITHNFVSTQVFDTKEIRPSAGAGNTLTIETVGNFNPLMVTNVISKTSAFINKTGSFQSANKNTVMYTIEKFPASFQIMLSSGAIIDLELYKSADWMVKLFLNR